MIITPIEGQKFRNFGVLLNYVSVSISAQKKQSKIPVVAVFGPITPINDRTKQDNLIILQNHAHSIAQNKMIVIDIVAFENVVVDLCNRNEVPKEDISKFLVENWTGPIIKLFLDIAYFTYDWKESKGATLEYEIASKAGILISELSQ